MASKQRRISDSQRDHLIALANGERSAYPGLNIGTLSGLERRGLVSAKRGFGSTFSPRNVIKWRLTDAGRAIIEK